MHIKKIAPDGDQLLTMHDKDKARMLNFEDWDEQDMRSINARTLIISGDQDVVTLEHAIEMTRLIPDARLMLLPGTHGSFIGEICTAIPGSKIPELTAAIIEEFLNQ